MASEDQIVKPPISFLSLPRELRDEIYNYVFPSKKPLNLYAAYIHCCQRKQNQANTKYDRLNVLNVTSSNGLVANEARQLLFSKCSIRTTAHQLPGILIRGPRLLGDQHFHFDIKTYLRMISVAVNVEIPPSWRYWDHLQFLLQCPMLETVLTTVRDTNSLKGHPNKGLWYLRNASKDITERFGAGLSFRISFMYKWDIDCDHRCPYPRKLQGRDWNCSWADLDHVLKDDMVQYAGMRFRWSPCKECSFRDYYPQVWRPLQ